LIYISIHIGLLIPSDKIINQHLILHGNIFVYFILYKIISNHITKRIKSELERRFGAADLQHFAAPILLQSMCFR